MVCSSSTSICSGVLDSLRMICVSVSIFFGIRLSSSTRSGRMSWCMARCSVITKMFSLSSCSVAGSWSGMRIGMTYASFLYMHVRAGCRLPSAKYRWHHDIKAPESRAIGKPESKLSPRGIAQDARRAVPRASAESETARNETRSCSMNSPRNAPLALVAGSSSMRKRAQGWGDNRHARLPVAVCVNARSGPVQSV